MRNRCKSHFQSKGQHTKARETRPSHTTATSHGYALLTSILSVFQRFKGPFLALFLSEA